MYRTIASVFSKSASSALWTLPQQPKHASEMCSQTSPTKTINRCSTAPAHSPKDEGPALHWEDLDSTPSRPHSDLGWQHQGISIRALAKARHCTREAAGPARNHKQTEVQSTTQGAGILRLSELMTSDGSWHEGRHDSCHGAMHIALHSQCCRVSPTPSLQAICPPTTPNTKLPFI